MKSTCFSLLLLLCFAAPLSAQKMLLLERKNSPRTTKYYVGDVLTYQYRNDDMWYTSMITDVLVDQRTLKLDQFAIPIDSIGAFKVSKKPVAKISGGALMTFGATLVFASTIALLYNEKDYNYGQLYGGAVASAGAGYLLIKPKRLKLGAKHRLRVVEVRFPGQE